MTESSDNMYPEPTEEDLRLARCWKRGLADKQFRGGLKYSDYREYSAEELEAMDLASFRKTWQAVEVRLFLAYPTVTEDTKRTYIDECHFFGGFRLADGVYKRLDHIKSLSQKQS